MTKAQIRKNAFLKSIPIMCSYIFVSMAYGIMMENAGFGWYYSLFVSLTVYTGAFQFVLITFLSSGASIVTIALTAFLMNSRQTFYSLTFLKDFQKMGRRKLYMIPTMTDETYAVNTTLDYMPEDDKHSTMFGVALFSVSPLRTAIVCIVPRVLMGWLTAVIFKAVSSKDKTSFVQYLVASITGPLLNTILFTGTLLLLFNNAPIIIQLKEQFGSTNVMAFAAAFVGVNGLIEAGVCAVLGTALCKALSVAMKKMKI